MSTFTVNLNNVESSLNSVFRNHRYVEENTPRRPESVYTYGGVTSTVGVGGDYSTLGAAISGISTGDIIQFLDGTYLSTDESAGYFLINDATKSYKVTGNPNDRGAVTLKVDSLETYLIYVRRANEVTFENLTIESTDLVRLLVINMSIVSEEVKVKFKNCHFKYTGSFASGVNSIVLNGNPVNNGVFEFVGCKIEWNRFENSSCFVVVDLDNTEANTYDLPMFFSRCEFVGKINVNSSIKLFMYDCYELVDEDQVILRLGTDGLAPTYTAWNVDIRGCLFEMGDNGNQHGVLLSRGVNKVVFQNNIIKRTSSDESASIGLVVKSIASVLSEVNISGNLIEYPRPLYLKGAQNCEILNNTSVSNFDDTTVNLGFGIELGSPTEEIDIDCIDNVIQKNSFYGVKSAIGVDTETSQTTTDIIKSNTFKDNQYLVKNNSYVSNPSTDFENRISVFGLIDVNSTFYVQ